MTPVDFTEKKWGEVLKQPEGYWAFKPHPLPPLLDPNWLLVNELTRAQKELSHLSGLARNLSNPHLLIGPFIRREAVLSSRIEGTQASLSDLFFFEAAHPPRDDKSDVNEVANYVNALEYGLTRLETLPISLRLLGELHERLMAGARGGHLAPGEFRRSQNWIGSPGCSLSDAAYVPPPVVEMKEALGQLENFIHAPSDLPALIRLAMVHYQFEAIHPYLDGNGRVGRLLITLILCAQKLLTQPLLYLSAFFEKNRSEYYRHLLAVTQRGEWQQWLCFFLRGITEQSLDSIQRTEKLLDLKNHYTQKIQSLNSSASALRLLEQLFMHPVLSIAQAARLLKISPRSASLNIAKLVSQGILAETTGRARYRLFVAQQIIKVSETDDLTSIQL